eukprot:2184713-Prymnesium_polylepis.1
MSVDTCGATQSAARRRGGACACGGTRARAWRLVGRAGGAGLQGFGCWPWPPLFALAPWAYAWGGV